MPSDALGEILQVCPWLSLKQKCCCVSCLWFTSSL